MTRPPELDGVEVYNSVTLATRVRISILRVSFYYLFYMVQCSLSILYCFHFVSLRFVCKSCFLCRRWPSGTSSCIRTMWSSFRPTTLGPASGSRPPRTFHFVATILSTPFWTSSLLQPSGFSTPISRYHRFDFVLVFIYF